MDTELDEWAEQLGQALAQAGRTLATAESCTGGALGAALTAIPGSSRWYECGFITYSNTAKRELLGVKTEILARHGAVSESTARAMAEGALTRSHADLAVAITGIAGPAGGTAEKPVGTVCFAWASRKQPTESLTQRFDGNRESVRRQAILAALAGLGRRLIGPDQKG